MSKVRSCSQMVGGEKRPRENSQSYVRRRKRSDMAVTEPLDPTSCGTVPASNTHVPVSYSFPKHLVVECTHR